MNLEFNDAAKLFLRMAEWFAHNEPGTPVPDWCLLATPISEEDIAELIASYTEDTRLSVHESFLDKEYNNGQGT